LPKNGILIALAYIKLAICQ